MILPIFSTFHFGADLKKEAAFYDRCKFFHVKEGDFLNRGTSILSLKSLRFGHVAACSISLKKVATINSDALLLIFFMKIVV